MSDNTTEIIIDLEKDNLPDNVSINEMVQIEARNRLDSILKKYTTWIDAQETKNKMFGVRNVIFINGARGSGKSTFLKTMLRELCHSETPSLSLKNHRFAELGYIDPTLAETGEHIMLSILVKMEELVRNNTKYPACGYDDNIRKYEDWRQCLKSLTRGLSLLSPSGLQPAKDPYGHLDEYIEFNERLSNVQGSLELKDYLADLVKRTLEIIKKDTLVLAFDDVDINFSRGWDVLELIRRYMDIPNLLILITGDLQLYIQLIRNKQFDNFGESLLRNDEERKDERMRLVDHLEQQYLMKLFPIPQRITLKSMYELSKNYPIKITSRADNNPLDVRKYVADMLIKGFSLRASDTGDGGMTKDVAQYVDALLKVPTRTLLQIITDYAHYSTAKNTSTNDNNLPNALAASLRKAMTSSLYKNTIDINALEDNNFSVLIEAVFDFTLRDGDLDTGFYLRPLSSDDTLKDISLVLSAEIASNCYHDPAKVFRYMLQGLGSVSLYNAASGTHSGDAARDSFKNTFKEYFAIGRNETSRHWALRAPSVLLENSLKTNSALGVGIGTMRVNQKKSKRCPDGKDTWNSLLKKIESKCERETKNQALQNSVCTAAELAYYSLKSMESFMFSSSNAQIISVFNMFSVIERLLDILANNPKDWDEDIKKISHTIMSGNTVSVPLWVNAQGVEDGEVETGDTSNENENDVSMSSVEILIKQWLKKIEANKLNDRVEPSALLIGKIWTRMYYTQSAIREESRSLNPFDYIRMNIIAILNAILCEESSFHKSSVNHSIPNRIQKNPVTQPNEFDINLTNILGDNFETINTDASYNAFPLFTMVVTCPLIWPFIDNLNVPSTDPKNKKNAPSKNFPTNLKKFIIKWTEEKSTIDAVLNINNATPQTYELLQGMKKIWVSGETATKPTVESAAQSDQKSGEGK
ncbi:MAG: hypothetical protein RRY12_08705 [Cloacibacillus sp.]